MRDLHNTDYSLISAMHFPCSIATARTLMVIVLVGSVMGRSRGMSALWSLDGLICLNIFVYLGMILGYIRGSSIVKEQLSCVQNPVASLKSHASSFPSL